jgi:hypothetical protein
MKIPTMIGVATLAVATVAVTAAASGGGSVRLPLPQAAMRSQHPLAGPAGSSTGGTLPSGADPSNNSAAGGVSQPPVYNTSPPAVLTGCSVSVSNPAPLRGQTAETATVATTTGAEVRLEADYVKTRSVHDGIADASGNAYFALTITHAQPGVTVRVTATVSLRRAKYSCAISFTPVDPVGVLPTAGGGQ